jgi:hypothetical protein
VTTQGPRSTYLRTGDSGGKITSSFCPTCGSTVFWEIDKLPDVIGIAFGAFADGSLPQPTVSVYGARRHPWAKMPELELEDLD